ncbi:MAG: polyprenyl synthetase family protein, partial [Phycisphaerae bacterium]|nr:polyprenyl synthetase family protein [Phycisphaerae bacterium]
MSASTVSERATDFISSVRVLVADRARNSLSLSNGGANVTMLAGGKMLRTRLAARLLAEQPAVGDMASLQKACAAMELVHAASLCHDDVLDNALIRRGQPALWRAQGARGAILIGDMLLCEAVELAMEAGQHYLRRCIEKVSEVVEAEA